VRNIAASSSELAITSRKARVREIFPAILRRLLRSRFVRSTGVMVGGTAISQIIGVAAAPVLTRMYSPYDFGVYQSFLSLLGCGLVMASLRYEIAIPLAPNSRRAAHVLVLALAVALASAGVTLLVGVVAVGSGRWTLAPGLKAQMYFIALGLGVSLLFGGVAKVFNYWGIRELDFGTVAQGNVCQVGVQTGTAIAAGLWKPAALGLILADALGRTASAAWLGHRYFGTLSGLLRKLRTSHLRAVMRRYKDFPLISSPSSLVNTVGIVVTPLMLLRLYGASAAGFFALADRVVGAPSMLIATALSQVFAADLARLRTAPGRERVQFVKKIAIGQILLGTIPFGLFWTLGPRIFVFVFGPSWSEAGEYARVLAALAFVCFISAPLNLTLSILERQRWQFGWDLGRLVLVVAVWFAAWALHFDARSAMTLYVLVGSLTYIAFFCLCVIALTLPRQRAVIA